MNQTIELKIEGMSCGHCVSSVKRAIESVSGVESAEVSLEKGSAVVQHDGGADIDAIKEAVREEGYESEEANRSKASCGCCSA